MRLVALLAAGHGRDRPEDLSVVADQSHLFWSPFFPWPALAPSCSLGVWAVQGPVDGAPCWWLSREAFCILRSQAPNRPSHSLPTFTLAF